MVRPGGILSREGAGENREMPNVHLTDQMHRYAQGQIDAGAYANLSEVVRAGLRLLMERDGARQFYALKGDLEAAVRKRRPASSRNSIL